MTKFLASLSCFAMAFMLTIGVFVNYKNNDLAKKRWLERRKIDAAEFFKG